ncbi:MULTISPECIES: recombinase family protein [unclassified Modestobacter]|uniref:recombinase family protein n=1 Tax=unclassified Modestobacter TaxID=2643866 RepID=UPI0022AA6DDD|nr:MULTISPECIES: recombinase family protein [unclassified Modestobacter]MCZ2824184.1 recombinase family protein [Modestobacter sp. VKM Ac-2981]MCZ2854288.1 recombinase family protein [Modestobacter sp. VKM Ac-2982]
MTTRAVIYLRQSLDRDGTGQAVERQREACRKLAEARGWTVVTEYVDNSVSATTGVRPQWTRMLADAEAGHFDVILAWALDRLTRSTRDLERLVDLGERTGVRCATASGDIDLSTDAGRLVGRILAAVARAEIERRTERQRLANAQRAAQGRPPTGPRALGWLVDGVTPHPDEAPAVAAAFDAVLAGASLRTVARDWNAAGLTTTHGGPWRPDGVRYVLTNPRYAGLRATRSGGGRAWQVVGPGSWTGIVGEETFRAVAELLGSASRRTSPDTRRRYFLSGLARCGVCGAPCNTGGTQHGVRTLKCSVSRHLSRSAEPIESWVGELVVARLSRPDAAELLVDTDLPDVTALRSEAAAKRARLGQLADLLADGTLTPEAVRTASARLRAELADVEARMADSGRADVLGPLVHAGDVRAVWAVLDPDRQRAVVDALMTVTLHSPGRGRRNFDPDTVEVTPR